MGAEPLTRTISSLNDALTRRLIEIVGAGHDLAGLEWCWLALGSEGRASRRSPPTRTTRCCSRSPRAGADADAVRARLLPFARDVNAGLDHAGLSAVHRQRDGEQSELCLSVDEWKAKFLKWIREPSPLSLLNANIVFDFRPLYGDTTLCDSLRAWLLGYTEANPAFLRLMVQNALDVDPPIGLIHARSPPSTTTPASRGTLDLKTRGARLFVDCARVFALARRSRDGDGGAPLAGERLRVEQHVQATIEHSISCSSCACASRAAAAARPSQPTRPVLAARDRPADAEGVRQASSCRSGCACRTGCEEAQDEERIGSRPAPGRPVRARRGALQLPPARALRSHRDRVRHPGPVRLHLLRVGAAGSQRCSRW
ncbi:MAG: DUF294 nucleotidyltransferase-like domain-containing protein [Burkholderiales bacterium]